MDRRPELSTTSVSFRPSALYVAGGNSTNIVKSVRTRIGWLESSNVCNSGASYSVTIVHGSPGALAMAGYSRSVTIE